MRHSLGYAISKVEVDGTLYPGYAGTYAVTNTQTISVANSSATVSLTFSNVPVGNNEWADFDFYAIAPDSSKFYLGSYGKIVNISQNASTTITLDAASTQHLQALDALIGYSILDANDLATTPDLESQITAQLSAAGITGDPTTLLLTQASIVKYIAAETPVYAHTLTITAPAGAATVSIVADDTNAAAADLALWPLYIFDQSYYNYGPASTIAGVPYAYGTPTHLPSTGPLPAIAASFPTYYTISPGSLYKIPVYGGPLIVGATNGTVGDSYGSWSAFTGSLPFTGSWARVAGRSAGTSSVTVPALTNTEFDVATSDPKDWAFAAQPTITVYPTAILANSYRLSLETALPTTYSSAHPSLAINTWNPAQTALSAYTLCDNWSDCQLANATTTLAIAPPFGDPGTNFSWNAWTAADAATNVAAVSTPTPGYAITYPAGATTVSMSTAKPSYLTPGQYLTVAASYQPDASSPAAFPAGTTATFTVIDSDGVSHANTGSLSDYSYYNTSGTLTYGSSTSITMSSLNVKTAFSSAKLTFTLPSAASTSGTFIVQSVN